MRRHHEELAATSALWPSLSLLVPFSAALWARISLSRTTKPAKPESLTPAGEP